MNNDLISRADAIEAVMNTTPFTPAGISAIIELLPSADAVEVVRCKDCKHRPIKEDADGEDYGFNIIKPTYGDERCPCLVEDGWYSWMPKDDFYCGYGEREGE